MATEIAFVLLVVLLLAIGLGFILRAEGLRRPFLDEPNERSLHAMPVPRSGGLAIHAAIVAGVAGMAALSMSLPDAVFWMSWFLVVLVSAWDDLGHVPAGVRLAAHLAAAGAWLFLGADAPGWPLLASGLAVVALAWFINLFNFMDGMDGLAGLMAVTGSLCLALAGLIQGQVAYAVLLAIVACAVGGFLFHNWPPARLFMGDSGAAGLGFLLGALGLYGIAREIFTWTVPVLVFLPFIVDATVTVLVRIFRGNRPWEAHREHFYQRLALRGWPAGRVLVIEFLIMSACQLAALWIVVAAANG